MSKVSKDFGALITEFLRKNSLTFRAAALNSTISAAYWKDISDGRVPSEEVIERICQNYEDLDENDLRIAAGYAPKTEKMDAVKAVEFALRGQTSISEAGKKQILAFVQEISKGGKGKKKK